MDDFKTPDHLRGLVADVLAELQRLGYPNPFEATTAMLLRIQDGELETREALLRLSHLLRMRESTRSAGSSVNAG